MIFPYFLALLPSVCQAIFNYGGRDLCQALFNYGGRDLLVVGKSFAYHNIRPVRSLIFAQLS